MPTCFTFLTFGLPSKHLCWRILQQKYPYVCLLCLFIFIFYCLLIVILLIWKQANVVRFVFRYCVRSANKEKKHLCCSIESPAPAHHRHHRQINVREQFTRQLGFCDLCKLVLSACSFFVLRRQSKRFPFCQISEPKRSCIVVHLRASALEQTLQVVVAMIFTNNLLLVLLAIPTSTIWFLAGGW